MNSKILVSVDLSKEARQVVTKAIELAKCFSASVEVIHVVEPVMLESPYDAMPALPVELEATLVDRAEEFLSGLVNELALASVKCHVKVGSVKNEVLRCAKDNNIDLIVIGTHGRHGIAMLLGSTANALLHGTTCDIYAVKIEN